MRAWDEFETKKRAVEEWASTAESLLSDKRVDSKQAVDFHKRFFQGADERAVSELVRSGRELIEVICNIIQLNTLISLDCYLKVF